MGSRIKFVDDSDDCVCFDCYGGSTGVLLVASLALVSAQERGDRMMPYDDDDIWEGELEAGYPEDDLSTDDALSMKSNRKRKRHHARDDNYTEDYTEGNYSLSSGRGGLAFIHIPKTGGTSIETEALAGRPAHRQRWLPSHRPGLMRAASSTKTRSKGRWSGTAL